MMGGGVPRPHRRIANREERSMNRLFSRTLARAVLAAALAAAPLAGLGVFSGDAALAAKGGNGKGGGGKGGGHGGKASSAAAKSEGAKASAKKAAKVAAVATGETAYTGKLAKKLGALNAANASAQAFANASPNSRVGRIRAYYEANQLALGDAAAAAGIKTALDAAIAGLSGDGDAVLAALEAYNALAADPANPDLQAAYDQALLDSGLSDAQVAGLDPQYDDWQAAEMQAEVSEQQAVDLLDLAANKTPVDADTRAALDALLAGKFPAP